MNRNKWFIECAGINDLMNEHEWMIHWMNRNEKSLIGQEWGIIDWTGMNDLLNEQEWMIQ